MQIGSFAVPISLLLFAATALAAHAVNRLRLRHHPGRGEVLDRVFTASVAGVLLWKFSYVLFYPQETIANPLSLLYFDGGKAGIWLGTALFLAIIGWNAWKRTTLRREYFGSGAVVIVAGMLFWGLFTAYESHSLRAGEGAPELVLEAAGGGGSVKLSDYRGKTVLLNFWASWCPPCRAEMPHLQQLHDALEAAGDDSDAVVITVNLTSTEKSAENVNAFLGNNGYSFPVLLDPAHEAAALYNVRVYPTTFVIDGEGVIRKTIPGAMTLETMEDAIRSVKQPKPN
ncbi:TlpA disulfide reductase family protein [Paenibacillus thermotolerans]|uniref:TlpA disulfide reductase family protein n=1 Tax=Paenibacillus thermotolerans TaxID=3027807 RepID=UPI002367C72B|nr:MULTISPECIES: TlpA disulfide reductase family protein [unclassified Paenibacillus]